MKNYKDIVFKYLREQKNRTLLTILGIILSVSLITAISTIILSVRDGMITETMKTEGSYHGVIKKLDDKEINNIKNHVDIGEYGIGRKLGSAPISEATEREQDRYGVSMPYRYIDIEELDERAINMTPVNLKEGRLPKNSNEIVIESMSLKHIGKDIKIGDKILLPYGKRIDEGFTEDERKKEGYEEVASKEYTLVGILNERFFWVDNLEGRAISGFDGELNSSKDYSIYVKVDNIKDANKKLVNVISDAGIDKSQMEYNDSLLRLSSEGLSETFNKSILLIVAFIFLIIIISTIAVIYNAFNISVIERVEQFGLLRSIGATPKQISSLVYREAGILTGIGVPLGIISGIVAMKVVLYIISSLGFEVNMFQYVSIKVYPQVIILSIILGIITVFLSVRGPARKAGKISPLDAIKGSDSIVKEDISKVKSSKLIRKVFGIEGEIAYKNLARNKKRLVITVFSMIISIVLFITFSTFSDMSMTIREKHEKDIGDMQIYGEFENEDKIIEEILSLDDVEYAYNINRKNGRLILEKDKMGKDLREGYYTNGRELLVEDGDEILESVEISSVGDRNLNTLKKNLLSGSVDIKNPNEILIVNSSEYHDQDTEEFVLIKNAFKYKVGDKIQFKLSDEDSDYVELKVIGVLDKGLLNESYNSNGGINIIASDKLLKELSIDEEYIDHKNIYIKLKEGRDKNQLRSMVDKFIEKDETIQMIDYIDMAKESRQNSIVISIFLYGFVTIITIISAINIINTISTNIILRTKEIGTIKAIGMTQKGVKKMISLESLYYGILASIIGSLIGVVFTFILFRLFVGISRFNYILPIKNILIASVGTIIISILAGRYPLRKINNKIIVESIKEDN